MGTARRVDPEAVNWMAGAVRDILKRLADLGSRAQRSPKVINLDSLLSCGDTVVVASSMRAEAPEFHFYFDKEVEAVPMLSASQVTNYDDTLVEVEKSVQGLFSSTELSVGRQVEGCGPISATLHEGVATNNGTDVHEASVLAGNLERASADIFACGSVESCEDGTCDDCAEPRNDLSTAHETLPCASEQPASPMLGLSAPPSRTHVQCCAAGHGDARDRDSLAGHETSQENRGTPSCVPHVVVSSPVPQEHIGTPVDRSSTCGVWQMVGSDFDPYTYYGSLRRSTRVGSLTRYWREYGINDFQEWSCDTGGLWKLAAICIQTKSDKLEGIGDMAIVMLLADLIMKVLGKTIRNYDDLSLGYLMDEVGFTFVDSWIVREYHRLNMHVHDDQVLSELATSVQGRLKVVS